VNAAGDILLTAGNNIFVDTITATASRKGKVTASFSANAGGDFSAAGVIDVEAIALGPGAQQASADIHIAAGNDIVLHGLTDLASVQSRGKGGNLTAIGDVNLAGNNVTDTGNVTVQATVAGRVAHSVLSDANLVLQAASATQINGNVAVAALADLSSADLVAAHAMTDVGGNNVTVSGDVNVEALASDRGSGNAVASALVNIHGSGSPANVNLSSVVDRASANVGGGGPAKSLADVTIQSRLVQVAGAIDVSANAHNFGAGPMTALNGQGAAGGALATASLDAHGANLGINAVQIQAHANDHGAGDAVAAALTNLAAAAAGSSGHLSVGSLTDIASAENWGGGSAKALANAVVRGRGGLLATSA